MSCPARSSAPFFDIFTYVGSHECIFWRFHVRITCTTHGIWLKSYSSSHWNVHIIHSKEAPARYAHIKSAKYTLRRANLCKNIEKRSRTACGARHVRYGWKHSTVTHRFINSPSDTHPTPVPPGTRESSLKGGHFERSCIENGAELRAWHLIHVSALDFWTLSTTFESTKICIVY